MATKPSTDPTLSQPRYSTA